MESIAVTTASRPMGLTSGVAGSPPIAGTFSPIDHSWSVCSPIHLMGPGRGIPAPCCACPPGPGCAVAIMAKSLGASASLGLPSVYSTTATTVPSITSSGNGSIRTQTSAPLMKQLLVLASTHSSISRAAKFILRHTTLVPLPGAAARSYVVRVSQSGRHWEINPRLQRRQGDRSDFLHVR